MAEGTRRERRSRETRATVQIGFSHNGTIAHNVTQFTPFAHLVLVRLPAPRGAEHARAQHLSSLFALDAAPSLVALHQNNSALFFPASRVVGYGRLVAR